MRRKSLAGTNGIPREGERAYVRVDAIGGDTDPMTARITEVALGDGRSWPVDSVVSRRSFGRAVLGNLCVRVDVIIAKRPKRIWWEGGRWFVSIPDRKEKS